jgi:hypothetical protein
VSEHILTNIQTSIDAIAATNTGTTEECRELRLVCVYKKELGEQGWAIVADIAKFAKVATRW